MKSEIITIGTELLLGNIINTNAAFLSEQLAELGIDVFYHTTVGDNYRRLKEAIQLSLERSDLVITTGGLGPTSDDITKDVVCDVTKRKPVLDRQVLEKINCFFKSIGRKMSPNNVKQAYIPEGGITVNNSNGTAPGIILETGKKIIIMLPGPPSELKPMFTEKIKPFLRKKSELKISSQTIKLIGIGESTVEHILKDIIENQTDPTIATYAGEGEVKIRLTTKSSTDIFQEESFKKIMSEIRKRLGEFIYSYQDLPLELVTARYLMASPCTLSVAESCTGGKISSLITSIPGISKSFKGSIISYSNEIKERVLRVKRETLENFGAVSRETAIQMARGVMEVCESDIGLAVTGIAGPTGGTAAKPVGLVFVSLCTEDSINCWEHRFYGDRKKIQTYAAKNALNHLRLFLVQNITGLDKIRF